MKFYNKINSSAEGGLKVLKNDQCRPGSFYIETIGCQQNEYDASKIAAFLKVLNFEEVSDDEANIIIILACAVRQMAVDRIYGRAKNWIESGKKVYITACVTKDDKKKLNKKGIIYFNNIDELPAILGLDPRMQKIVDSRPQGHFEYLGGNDTHYVPIMSGCNNFCSYCIVPYTRGRETSRPINDIITEVSNLIQAGNKEIVLLGQNVNSYKFGFADLLKKLNDLPGNFVISFMSNHPKDITDDVIDVVKALPKIKKEIHLPLQSGSDKVLKDMNRPYTSGQYLNLVEKLKSRIPSVYITTDLIVGFPTETEKDFLQTVEVCKKVGFSLAYVNKYSPRKEAAAFKLGDPISWQEKQRRWRILDEIINRK